VTIVKAGRSPAEIWIGLSVFNACRPLRGDRALDLGRQHFVMRGQSRKELSLRLVRYELADDLALRRVSQPARQVFSISFNGGLSYPRGSARMARR